MNITLRMNNVDIVDTIIYGGCLFWSINAFGKQYFSVILDIVLPVVLQKWRAHNEVSNHMSNYKVNVIY